MRVRPHPEANRILHEHFLAAFPRIPEADRMRIAERVRISVVTEAEYVETVGNDEHVAQFLALADGSYRVLLRSALASWPAAVSQYVMMHECAHAICGPDDEAADDLVAAWGFGPEMRQARAWGRLIAANDGFSYHPTRALAAA